MHCALNTAPTLYIVFVWPPNFTMLISIERKMRRFVYLSSRGQPVLLPDIVLERDQGHRSRRGEFKRRK
jgi:hypothetical protein